MELGLDLWVVAALCAVALVAGFIDAVAGGGGLLTVPALLTAGLPPHLVLGTNKLAATFGSITASVTYYRRKLFDPRFWRTALIFTAIGAHLWHFSGGFNQQRMAGTYYSVFYCHCCFVQPGGKNAARRSIDLTRANP